MKNKFRSKSSSNPSGAGAGGEQQQVVKQEEPKQQKPYVPYEASDNLFSRQYARILDVVCEGPIDGLCYPNGKKIRLSAHAPMAVYFDDVALMNTDSTVNIKGVAIGLLTGTQEQFAIPGFGGAMSLTQIGTPMYYNRVVSVAISNTDAVAFEVAVRIQSLVKQDKIKGDITPYSVQFKIEVSLNAGTPTLLETVTVSGKCSQPYVWSKAYKLPKTDPESDTDTWSVRVTRLSRDDTSIYKQSGTSLDFLNVINRGTFSYPNSAIVALEVDAEGYSTIPTRGYHLRLLKIQVPTNYFPETKEYNRDPLTGLAVTAEDTDPESDTFGEQIAVEQVWDGSFYVAWTDNPAWCFYDITTNARYGLGKYVTPADVDKWALYEIAKYCDVMVDDGYGGEEPRFTCNVYIQTAEEAYKVIQDFASIFRGIIYWAGGSLVAVQDRIKAPYTIFSDANVIDGTFSYTGTAKKARHTVAIVRWNDPDENFRAKYEYVEDHEGIAEFGYNEVQPVAFGCTSRGQARRLGRWTLLTELHETNTITFSTGTDGIGVNPGHVITVMDTNRAGVKNGGRILSIAPDRLSFTIDRPATLNANPATVQIVLPQFILDKLDVTESGTDSAPSRKSEYSVTNLPGSGSTEVSTIEVATPLDANIPVGAVWVIATDTVTPQYFRVVNITEKDKGIYEISGIQYFEGKYDATESDIALEIPDISALNEDPTKPASVNNLTAVRNVTSNATGPVLKIILAWERPESDPATVEYKTEWRRNSDPWEVLSQSPSTFAELVYTLPGTYEFKVTSIGRYGIHSDSVLISYTVLAETPIILYTITGLELVGADSTGQGNDLNFIGKDAHFQWRLNSPLAAPAIGDGDDEEYGIGVDGEDPYFQDFEFTVWDVSSGQQVYTAITKNPRYTYTEDMNRQSIGAPTIGRNQFTVKVFGRNKWGDVTDPAVLTVQNPAPQAPTNLQVFPAFRAVWLVWTNPTDIDFDYVNIYQGTTAVFADATLIGHQKGNTLFRGALEPSTTYYYWVVALDTFGTASTQHPTNGLSVTTSTVGVTDIADFAVKATSMFTKTIILTADVWTDNSPVAGKIAWNSHTLVYNGAKYTIAAGNTEDPFVIWRNGATSYTTTTVHPSEDPTPLADNDFIVATNTAGIHDLAWNGIANQVIGSAYIMDAAIKNAHIDNVSADKIQAGTISGQEVILAGTGGIIRSENYATGTAGWRIESDGTAEFNDLIVREAISVGTGYTNPDFPGRYFFPSPTVYSFIDSLWDMNSPALSASEGYYAAPVLNGTTNSYEYSTASPTRYLHRPIQSPREIVDGYEGALFAGVDIPSSPSTGDIDLGPEVDGLLYRRVAFSGPCNFRVTASAEAVETLCVLFAIIDTVVVPNYMDIPGDSTLPWNFLDEIQLAGDTSRRTFVIDRIYRITVPSTKCVVFSIASIDSSGNIGTNLLKLPSLSVTALNIGGPSLY